MALDGAEMIGKGIAGGFAGLGHEVGDVSTRGLGLGDGGGDFRNEEIGKNTGIERAGAEKDEVRLSDGFDSFGNGADAAGREREFFYGLAAGGDARFAVNAAAIFESGDKRDVRNGGRKDAAADGEDFAADADGFGKIAGNVRERGEKEVAEVMADEAASGVETILEKAAEQGFVLRKGDHAVADVTRRENAVFAAKAAGASAVIGNGDDGGEIGDGALGSGMFVAAANDVFLEAAK